MCYFSDSFVPTKPSLFDDATPDKRTVIEADKGIWDKHDGHRKRARDAV